MDVWRAGAFVYTRPLMNAHRLRMHRPTGIFILGFSLALIGSSTGCGTTHWSDTARTATEQMLISDAIDKAVSGIDFTVLASRNVYLDTKFISGTVDEKYIVSTLRQHMLASGCVIRETIDDAEFVVELRSGAVGTNRHQVLLGIPQTNLMPGQSLFPMAPQSIPEISLLKRTGQQGVCKIAVFAYNRQTGHPVWQSGIRQTASNAKDIWVLGTGPFQSGTIYEGTKFAGERLNTPLNTTSEPEPENVSDATITKEILFADAVKPSQQAPPANQPAPPNAVPALLPGSPPNIARLPAGPILGPIGGAGGSAAYDAAPASYASPITPPPMAPARPLSPASSSVQPLSR